MKSLLIGCGVTGSAIGKKIYSLPFIKSLDLYSRSGKTALDLQRDISSSKVRAIKNIKSSYDLIIVAISGISSSERDKSFQNRPTAYMVRQDELKFNLGSVIEIIDLLKKQKRARIIVITNPVDEITNFMNLRLNRKDIVGFGLELDSIRYCNILNIKKNYCFGTHGKAFPVLHDNVKKHYFDIYHLSDSRVMDFIRTKGMTSEITSQVFKEFLESFYSEKEQICQFTYSPDKNAPNHTTYAYGLPWRVKRGKVLESIPLSLNQTELSILSEVINQLKLSIKRLIVAEQKLLLYR